MDTTQSLQTQTNVCDSSLAKSEIISHIIQGNSVIISHLPGENNGPPIKNSIPSIENSTSKASVVESSMDKQPHNVVPGGPITGNMAATMRISRPGMPRYHSSPSVQTLSPTRHHFRLPNLTPREIKETLNARYREKEGRKQLNQYQLKQGIGKGGFGDVRLAVDETTNTQYAVKEYSKSRLLKLNRTELLQRRKALGKGKSVYQIEKEQEFSNPLNLIRREIAIMKKLDHPNIVNLIEVLDDPHGDSLFMILEWCEKGVIISNDIIKNGGSPYSEEQCRLYFRDMILGIEYLHSQGIVHRDIKADNVLLSEDDVVKIVDFGVSEMFDMENDVIKKKAGSPAYMAPELAILSSSHRNVLPSTVSGRAADIWAMGVTLYYISFGYLPFQADTMVDLFEKIIFSEPSFPESASDDLRHLLSRILEKDPTKRIRMSELRCDNWVTRCGEDPLLSVEENIADSITPVTDEDLLTAIERIQGVMDANHAAEKLRKLHGWRGKLDSSRSVSSRESSMSPVMRASEVPTFDDRFGLFKLTWALDEIISRGEAKSASLKASNSPLIEPEPMHLDYVGVSSEHPIEIKVSTEVDIGRGGDAYDNDLSANTEINSEEKIRFDNNERHSRDHERNTAIEGEVTVERRSSRSRNREFLGLQMTALRSRSLNTDDRL